MELDLIFAGAGAVAGTLAAYQWFRASAVEVPDNIDTIVAELRRAARHNAYGSGWAVVAAICAVILFLREAAG